MAQILRPRPLRALVTAHAEATRNRAFRELGRSGAWALAIFLVVIVTTFLAPLWLSMIGLGWALGKSLPGATAEAILGALLFGMSYFGGATSATISGAKQLTWESYRTYPVRLRHVFVAELLASVVDLMPIILGIATLSFGLGLAIANPRLLPLIPLVVIEGVLAVLLTQLLIGSLAERLIRRLRVVLNILVLVLAVGVVLGTMIPIADASIDPVSGTLALLQSLRPALERATIVLPTTWTAHSLGALAEGHFGLALIEHVIPILVLSVLAVFTARLLERDAASEAESDLPPSKLWSFKTVISGVAKLQFTTILDSRVGRFGLVFPLVVVVLVRGPLTVLFGRAPWAVPGAFLYVALLGSQFQLNQFGLDAHGTKALLLLPIREVEIWRGKARGILAYQTLQGTALAIFLAVAQRPSIVELVSGVIIFFAMVAFENTVGRATSVFLPRMLPRKRIQSNATPIGAVLIALVMSLGFGGLIGLGFALLARHAPAYRPLVALFLLAIALGVQRALLPAATRSLSGRKEKLLAALG